MDCHKDSIFSLGSLLTQHGLLCVPHDVYRNRKFIHLTSPNINYITCGGCMVLYTSIFFLAIQSTDETITTAICNKHSLFAFKCITGFRQLATNRFGYGLWAIGYSVALGLSWERCIVFTTYSTTLTKQEEGGQGLDDCGVLISVLASIDVIILVIVTAVPELRTTAVLKQSTEYPADCVWSLSTTQPLTGLIQVVAILLAFGTRKVKVKGLNDSKYIAAIIYVTSICLVVVIISFATLRDKVNTLAAIYSLGFWCAATIILLLVFIPKVYVLYKDPLGEKIFPATVVVQTESDHGKVLKLERRIQELQQQLAQEHQVCEEMRQLCSQANSTEAIVCEEMRQLCSQANSTEAIVHCETSEHNPDSQSNAVQPYTQHPDRETAM
eukprot:Em0013g895a